MSAWPPNARPETAPSPHFYDYPAPITEFGGIACGVPIVAVPIEHLDLPAEPAPMLTPLHAVTDGDGRYVFDGLCAEESYDLEAQKDGYDVEIRGEHTRSRANSGDIVDFTAKELVTLEIDVRQSGGAPKSARILCFGSTNRVIEWSPEHRTIALSRGDWRLRAAETRDPCRAWSEAVDVQLSGPQSAVILTLQTCADVEVKIVDAAIDHPTPFRVGLAPFHAQIFGREDMRRIRTKQVSANADHPGVVLFENVVCGRAEIEVTRDHEVVEKRVVEIVEGRNVVAIEVAAPNRSSHIFILTSDPLGDPIDVDHVGTATGDAARRGESVGEYLLPRSPKEPWSQGNAESSTVVKAFDPRFGTVAVPCRRTTDEIVLIAFREPAHAAVSVRATAPGQKVAVELERDRDESAGRRGDTTTVKGSGGTSGSLHVKLPPLQPGRYAVEVFRVDDEGRYSASPLIVATVELRSGPNTIELTCPESFDLTVAFSDFKAGESAWLEGPLNDGRGRLVKLLPDENGVASVRGTAAGNYYLYRAPSPEIPWPPEMPIRIDGNLRVQLDVREATGLVVATAAPECRALGLAADDVILSADGKAATASLVDVRRVLKYAATTVTLEIERNGKTHSRTIDAATLRKLESERKLTLRAFARPGR